MPERKTSSGEKADRRHPADEGLRGSRREAPGQTRHQGPPLWRQDGRHRPACRSRNFPKPSGSACTSATSPRPIWNISRGRPSAPPGPAGGYSTHGRGPQATGRHGHARDLYLMEQSHHGRRSRSPSQDDEAQGAGPGPNEDHRRRPGKLKAFKELQWLGLQRLTITTAGLEHVKSLPRLQQLDLGGCNQVKVDLQPCAL